MDPLLSRGSMIPCFRQISFDVFTRRVEQAKSLLAKCRLCPHRCGANRAGGEKGFCGIGRRARVASFGPHFGEESVLVGQGGSGAIFFAGCNLQCVFCQNADISMRAKAGEAEPVSARGLADIMLHLQEKGCCNINLVTPSHVIPQVIAALHEATKLGLNLPVVYNSSGYDSPQSLRLLDGLIDIYMPDCKLFSPAAVRRYLQAEDYPRVMQAALLEMHRQVGDLLLDEHSIARRGLLVRHLVMPGLPEESREIVRFLADSVSSDTYLNIMDQYHPCHRAHRFPEINRSLTRNEYEQAVTAARGAGLHRFEEHDISRLLALLAQG